MPRPEPRAEHYKRRGLLAIHPKAFTDVYWVCDAPPENTPVGDCMVVDIRGPLEQHEHYWCDSYPAILQRVREACASPARAVILRFDCPGGMAQGCFEAAREMRAICDQANKPVHTFVDGDCCSAAYAFASHTHSITIGDAALVGSVGVLSAREDYSAANAQAGLRVVLTTSGERKADGHPDQPVTDAELAATQAIVDSLGQVFMQHVAAGRGIAVESLAALQANVMHGQAAVDAGLADAVGTLSTVLARVASGAEGTATMGPFEKARAALEEAAKGDDPNAKAAQRALAALGGEGEGGEDKPAEETPDPAKDPAAEGGEKDREAAGDPPAADDDKEERKAAAGAYRAAIEATREVQKLRAEIAQRDEREERAKLLASKPMAAEMKALLQKAPIALVRETVASLPESPLNPELGAAPTRGDTSGGGARLSAAEKRALDERMGLATAESKSLSTDYKLVLGAPNNPKVTIKPLGEN